MTDIEARIQEFGGLWFERPAERWIRAIAEEAGEVVGAFNKWQDGNKRKPKCRADVIEEMAQLMGCVYYTAHKLGVPYSELLEQVDGFMAAKVKEIQALRAGAYE